MDTHTWIVTDTHSVDNADIHNSAMSRSCSHTEGVDNVDSIDAHNMFVCGHLQLVHAM